MEVLKIYSKNSFWLITVFGLLIAVGINSGLYYGLDWFLLNFSKEISEDTILKNISWLFQQVGLLVPYFYKLVVPSITGIVLLIGWFLWLLLRNSFSNVIKHSQDIEDKKSKPGRKKKDFIDHKIEQDRKRRLFLHSLSVLQRDGRLLDFFDEDLSLYDDEQIGAAVRSIQEDCKKTVKKYIDPKPVMDNDEGETVTIEPGFDIDSIKLIGNVAGEPPFEGVLKHRGWKAGKKEIPKLSDVQDATIIIPAEVEIQ